MENMDMKILNKRNRLTKKKKIGKKTIPRNVNMHIQFCKNNQRHY